MSGGSIRGNENRRSAGLERGRSTTVGSL